MTTSILLVHGHHHDDYDAAVYDGALRVVGVGEAQGRLVHIEGARVTMSPPVAP